jgi:hypothetical protein
MRPPGIFIAAAFTLAKNETTEMFYSGWVDKQTHTFAHWRDNTWKEKGTNFSFGPDCRGGLTVQRHIKIHAF